MSTVRQELAEFHQFALSMIDDGEVEPTLEEIIQSWSVRLTGDDVAAVEEALLEMDRGDLGEDADVVIQKLLSELPQRS